MDFSPEALLMLYYITSLSRLKGPLTEDDLMSAHKPTREELNTLKQRSSGSADRPSSFKIKDLVAVMNGSTSEAEKGQSDGKEKAAAAPSPSFTSCWALIGRPDNLHPVQVNSSSSKSRKPV